MTTYGAVSFGFQAVGLALVVVGLYRRDTEAQRWLRALRGRARSWFRRLLRRGATVHVGGASSTVSVGTKARGSVRPGPRNPDAPMGERVAWLEHAVDVAFRELDSERQWTNDDVRDIREGLRGLTSEHRQAVARLGRELDDVRAPERLEWWGAGVVAVGLAFAVIDVATAATQSGGAG